MTEAAAFPTEMANVGYLVLAWGLAGNVIARWFRLRPEPALTAAQE